MSDRFVVGDTVTLSNTFAVSGTATDPTTVSLVVTDPAGTATTYTYAGATITKSSTGVYTKNVTASTVGRWSYLWTGTGTAADLADGTFVVYPLPVAHAAPAGWSYTARPATVQRDAVRYLIGDNSSGVTPTLSDEEVDYEVVVHGSADRAAAYAARSLAAKFARQPASKKVGDLAVTYGDRAKSLFDLADRLAHRADLNVVPLAGGISVADKTAVEDDTDRVTPAFARGMHDHPDADSLGRSTGPPRW